MKRLFLLNLVVATTVAANAQRTERVSLKAGESVAEAFAPKGFFRFPQFTEGTFLMKNGTHDKARFNYNIATGEILFIKGTGDTAAIGVPEELDHIMIGENTEYIYNNKSYLEILSEANHTRLAKRVKVNIEKDKKGGYGESAPTSSQDQLANFNWGTQLYHLGHDVTITKTTSYYWLDERNNPQPTNRKNSLRLVSKDKQSKLEAFIVENKTDFNSEDDLRKLLAFAGTL